METLAQEAFASTVAISIKLIFAVGIVLIPIVLVKVFWKNWMMYVRAKFFTAQKYVILECRLPKGVIKPPLSMELIINTLFQPGGEGTWIDRYIDGSTRSWFSLEMVSIEGQVRFFIWMRAKFKDMVETQLYSQYPDIEIEDVSKEDYAAQVPYNPEKYGYWGCEFRKTGAQHLPIKTYTAFGMTSASDKEEGKIDPLTPLIEYLGSLGKGEQAWLQVCIRSHGKNKKKPGTWFEKVDWQFDAAEDLKKRTKRDIKIDPTKPVAASVLTLTEQEKESVKAIEQNLSKVPFDCGIRAIYVAEKDKYKKSSESGLGGAYTNFSAPTLNTLKAVEKPGFDYPWQDWSGKKTAKQKKDLFQLYQARAFFIPQYKIFSVPGVHDSVIGDKSFVMTTEELATIYHFPGQVARTPSLSRVSAKRVEPPTNLPI
jgi:hypothetical protein